MRKSIFSLTLAAAALVLFLGGDAFAQRGGGRHGGGGHRPSGGHRPGGNQQMPHQHKPHHHKPSNNRDGSGGDGGGSEAPGGEDPVIAEAPAGGEVVTESATEAAADEFFNEKYLTVRNSTNLKVRFYVLFYTEEEGRWEWVPGTPGKTKKALSWELEPGKSMKLQMDNEAITAQKIRIWAKGGDRTWDQYRQSDLYLVEQDSTGERRYQADDVATYVFDLKE